jgi:hypothetical protein
MISKFPSLNTDKIIYGLTYSGRYLLVPENVMQKTTTDTLVLSKFLELDAGPRQGNVEQFNPFNNIQLYLPSGLSV